MANKGTKKRKSKYNNSIRIKNAIKRLTKHLKKHSNDSDAKKKLKVLGNVS